MRFLLLFLPVLALAQSHREDAFKLPEKIQNKVFRAQISADGDKEGKSLTYRVQTGPRKSETVRIDLATGERKALPANADQPANLTWEGPHRTAHNGPETSVVFENHLPKRVEMFWVNGQRERKSYGFVQPGESHTMQTYVGHAFVLKESTGRELGWFYGLPSPARVTFDEKTLPAAPAKEPASAEPGDSPKFAVHDHNVFNGKTPLTTDGDAKSEYRAPVHPSPDGKHLLAMKVEPEQEHLVYYVEAAPKDQLQPKLHSHQYLKPGDRIAHPHPRLIDLTTRKVIPVDETLMPTPWALTNEHWSPDSKTVFLLYNQRGHQVERLIAIDAQTGATRVVIEETSKTFIDYSQKTYLQFLDAAHEVLWASERDGWNHLYLFDTQTSKLKNAVTHGPWVMRKVEHVDDTKRQVWFMASGLVSGQDPYYQQLCRVNFDGSGFVQLTDGDGTHEVKFSPDRKTFIDTWSRVDQPPINQLRHSADGKLIADLEKADASALLAAKWQMPERFTAKGRDGSTDIYGVIYKPTHFDPAKKYPVVEEIYAGPHGQFVPKSWGLEQRQHQIAELGFIIVQIDGMGTNWRSRAFHDVCWKNLKDSGLPDRIAWLKTAAKTRPWMDLTRVGIYGGSAGGQSVGAALLHHGDFYKVGVADCGCHDNRMDKIWWPEAWMGWPLGPEYADNSNATHAAKLTGKLMLMVGEMDTNVDPATTLQFADALAKAGKNFELVVVPGTGHGSAETPFGFMKRLDFLRQHLLRE